MSRERDNRSQKEIQKEREMEEEEKEMKRAERKAQEKEEIYQVRNHLLLRIYYLFCFSGEVEAVGS